MKLGVLKTAENIPFEPEADNSDGGNTISSTGQLAFFQLAFCTSVILYFNI